MPDRCCRNWTLISSLAAIIYWIISVHFPALANAYQWHIFPAVILLWPSYSLLSRLIHRSLFSLSAYLFNDRFKVNMSNTELLIFAPVFNTWITGNSVILTSRAKIVSHSLHFIPSPICLEIQLALISKYIQNPNIFQDLLIRPRSQSLSPLFWNSLTPPNPSSHFRLWLHHLFSIWLPERSL